MVLGLLWCNVGFAKDFFVGQEISNNFIYNKDIQINLSGNNWVVIRKNTQLEHVKQEIVGIGRVKDNEIMEMIEIYEGALAGYYVKYVDQIIQNLNDTDLLFPHNEKNIKFACVSEMNIFGRLRERAKLNMVYENKKTHKMKLEGLASRVFQHEYDHMEGIDFTQRT